MGWGVGEGRVGKVVVNQKTLVYAGSRNHGGFSLAESDHLSLSGLLGSGESLLPPRT